MIDELGYEASLVARSLRNQRTNVIGILVAGIEPFSAELLKGAARALQDSSYELVVYSGGMHGEAGWERRYLSRLSGTLTDGTILVAPTVVEVSQTHPIVAVDPHVGASHLPTVDSQNFEGGVQATRHLIDLGHRRIGFLAGRSDLESARRREEGYRDALAEAGIEFDPALIQVGIVHRGDRAGAGQGAAVDGRPPDGDLRRQRPVRDPGRAYRPRDSGLQVPDDLSIVGFDNIPESALTEPPLTTVDQSIQDLGFEAVQMLLDLLDHPGAASDDVVDPRDVADEVGHPPVDEGVPHLTDLHQRSHLAPSSEIVSNGSTKQPSAPRRTRHQPTIHFQTPGGKLMTHHTHTTQTHTEMATTGDRARRRARPRRRRHRLRQRRRLG